MKRQYVGDLREGHEVNDYFAVRSKMQPRRYKNKDGMWFALELTDKTGAIRATFWGGIDEQTVRTVFASFEADDVVHISGGKTVTDKMTGKPTVHLNEDRCQIQKTSEYDNSELVARTTKDIPGMVRRFRAEIASVSDQNIRRLLESVFDDEFMRLYSESPAAKRHHHNYVGGLLEHVLSMIAISRTISGQYEGELNVDLLVAGCMLHDIGKVYEYKTGSTIQYTQKGKMLGHIPMGFKMVSDKIEAIEGFPEGLAERILHMILSHHGVLEYGSPVVPQFVEAQVLHKIDDCDAKTKYEIQEAARDDN